MKYVLLVEFPHDIGWWGLLRLWWRARKINLWQPKYFSRSSYEDPRLRRSIETAEKSLGTFCSVLESDE